MFDIVLVKESIMKPLNKYFFADSGVGVILLLTIGLIWISSLISCAEKNESGGSRELPYYVDSVLENMAQGNIAFNAPDSMMELGHALTVQLLLDSSRPIEELQRMIQERMIDESGVIEGYQIRISETMEARLTGKGFQITAITPEEQPVSTKEPTEWKWDITAIEYGTQRLHLTLSAILFFQGDKKTRSIKTFDKIILVKVSFCKRITSFIGKNWQWLWTTLLIPIVSWLWKRKKQDKK
jgi:hypothetical protein